MPKKAFDILKDIGGISIRKGQRWIEAGRERYKLTVLKGKINPRKWYYYKFNAPYMEWEADVILTLGTDEKQYLIEIDR